MQEDRDAVGFCDYLAVFKRVGKRQYFAVMTNIYKPGEDIDTGNDIVNKCFTKIPFDKLDLKGSWRSRGKGFKKCDEIKELDLMNITNRKALVFEENEHNEQLLRETFSGIYNALVINLKSKITDSSHMMQIAIQPKEFDVQDDPEQADDIVRALALKRTLCALPLEDDGSPRSGLKLLIRPTRILDNFQRLPKYLGWAYNLFYQRSFFKPTKAVKEGSRIKPEPYFHRACAFFDNYFKIKCKGSGEIIGCLTKYNEEGEKGFIERYKAMNKDYFGKSLEDNLKKELKLLDGKKKPEHMVLQGWFWMIKQRIEMYPEELPRAFRDNDTFLWMCHEACRLRIQGSTPELIAGHILNDQGKQNLLERCKRIIQIFRNGEDLHNHKNEKVKMDILGKLHVLHDVASMPSIKKFISNDKSLPKQIRDGDCFANLCYDISFMGVQGKGRVSLEAIAQQLAENETRLKNCEKLLESFLELVNRAKNQGYLTRVGELIQSIQKTRMAQRLAASQQGIEETGPRADESAGSPVEDGGR